METAKVNEYADGRDRHVFNALCDALYLWALVANTFHQSKLNHYRK